MISTDALQVGFLSSLTIINEGLSLTIVNETTSFKKTYHMFVSFRKEILFCDDFKTSFSTFLRTLFLVSMRLLLFHFQADLYFERSTDGVHLSNQKLENNTIYAQHFCQTIFLELKTSIISFSNRRKILNFFRKYLRDLYRNC